MAAPKFTYTAYDPPSRTPSPPPENPSPSYLAISSQSPPFPLPEGQRKLLIFDLNGTLLLRSPRRLQQRKIYLRPYMASLVAFIAHPRTRAFLDVMVWSSAQAHNVGEMVERVFGVGEGEGKGPILKAVWARDTLGLSKEAFYQKTQTTKDLAKPWSFFNPIKTIQSTVVDRGESNSGRYSPSIDVTRVSSPPPPSSSPAAPPSSLPPTSGPDPESEQEEPELFPHNAETTLLVDDSPLKARLQPWNHLCVAEYDAPMRTRDRAAMGLGPDPEPSPPRELQENEEPQQHQVFTEVDESSISLQKDRWRKRRRENEDGEQGDASASEQPTPSTNGGDQGFVAPQGMSKRAERKIRKRLRQAAQNGANGSAAADRLSSPDEAAVATNDDGSSSVAAAPSEAPPVENDPQPNSKKRKRLSIDEPPAPIPTIDSDEPFDPTLLAVVGVLDHVRTIGNVSAWIRSGGLSAIMPTEDDLPSDPNQWFTSRRLLDAWALRGRNALTELEIEAIPGVQ
ncbi:FCP1-like proteiny domain-containing protein [Mycena chlorophos]|uniref:Mitochondrial import inner membrane translocase subunit TIM50 n=1 Tax=Mycena chlorophos TaxID=658473 RepID=A0A8H6WLG3_MYCCL|nr:FCP1-like proteiny domain-containing protein [Mycena chlorophos]